jgi:hypothetical protein
MRRVTRVIAAWSWLVCLGGCASSVPPPKAVIERPLSTTIAGPAGWLDVTDKSLSPDVAYWLITDKRSASLLLKQLQQSITTLAFPADESIVSFAHISLRLKIAVRGNTLRVTQPPTLFDSNHEFAVYSYVEHELLRRVLVFRKGSRMYELELAQEVETDVFATHLKDQIAFAMSVLHD